MEKYSLEAKELLSESQMFEVKAGAVVKDHLQQECSLCDSCIGCASADTEWEKGKFCFSTIHYSVNAIT